MRTSSRPQQRKIRRSTLAIRREKWQRQARALMQSSFARMISDGDIAIPIEPKRRPPVVQPQPGYTTGGGGDQWTYAICLIGFIVAALLLLGILATR